MTMYNMVVGGGGILSLYSSDNMVISRVYCNNYYGECLILI